MPSISELLTPRQTSEFLKVSQATVCRMIHDRSLPAVALRSGKRSTCYRIRMSDLQQFINQRAERKAIDQAAANE
jgi:excisionase family DNA binding protein